MGWISGLLFYLTMTDLGREQFLEFWLNIRENYIEFLSRIFLLINWYAAT